MSKQKYKVAKPNLIQKVSGKPVRVEVGTEIEKEEKDARNFVKKGILVLAVAPKKVKAEAKKEEK